MIEKVKKQKTGSISEEDVSTILQRYTATTVLALLQEVGQVPDVKIDWNALVKKTTTGISNAREYQMLWRHMAYRDALLERLDDGAVPLEDDSDLEYELEAFPTVSSEASTEAAACVKVLIASGLPSDSSLQNGSTVEAPLTINIPNGQLTRAPTENLQLSSFMHGTNITVPVCVKKQSLPTMTFAEGLDANGSASGSLPARRKRKPWSAAEDMELIAAVQKCGEGNWANILKGDFKGDRTASQLSQRWAIIRKRKGSLNVGGGSQLSEAQLAARRAMSLALNMPMVDNLKAACSIDDMAGHSSSCSVSSVSATRGQECSVVRGGTNSNIKLSNSLHPTAAAEASSVATQPQQDSGPSVAQMSGTSGSSSKYRLTSKKPSTKSALSPDALVKAAAVAAGARIATPSDAASLLKAAQAKNAVHIMPGGGSLIKSSVAGNSNPLPSPHLGPYPNVHYIRTGLVATPLSTYSTPPNASQPGGHIVKPAAPMVPSYPSSTAPESDASSEATNATTSIPTKEVEVKTAEDIVISSSVNPPKDLVQADQAAVSGNAPREQVLEDRSAFSSNASKQQVQEDQASVQGNAIEELIQEDRASVVGAASNKQVREDQTALPSFEKNLESQMDYVANSKCSSAETTGNDQMVIVGNRSIGECKNKNDDNMMSLPVDGDDNHSTVMDICDNQTVNGKQDNFASMVVDGSDEKVEFLGEAAAGTENREEKRAVGLE